jgi:hypothetical protein
MMGRLGWLSSVGVLVAVLLSGIVFGVVNADEPSKGRIPDSAIAGDGSTRYSEVPDLVVALDRDGNEVGFVAREDIFPELRAAPAADENAPIPVVDADGRLIGYMYPDLGFVRLGESPPSRTPATTSVPSGRPLN